MGSTQAYDRIYFLPSDQVQNPGMLKTLTFARIWYPVKFLTLTYRHPANSVSVRS